MNIHNNKYILLINRLEDGLLVIILSCMILLAILQVISRNLFSDGYVWIDPLLRLLVLWVGLSGAVVAARTDHHIRIDFLTKNLPQNIQLYIHRCVYFFTAVICLLIGWHAFRFVYSEYEYGTVIFASVPAWLAASIIPLSFLLIALRYAVLMFSPPCDEQDRGR